MNTGIPGLKVLHLDLNRMPADALAFYRPFHIAPFDQWGIYIMAERLYPYCHYLWTTVSKRLQIFTFETLLAAVLFEVFHHEFFHHLVESTATTVEIISACFGEPKPIYRDYWLQSYKQNLGSHPHTPLEEALANAYAFNSFSFMSRVQAGYKVALVKTYQAVLKKVWPQESAGYREAGQYISSGYISGAAQLLAMLLGSDSVDPSSLLLIGRTVMPCGHSALTQKADVPTYLVGSQDILEKFYELVPAPNETYTNLFWLLDTDPIDKYLQERVKAEKEAKKDMRGGKNAK